MKKRDGGGRVIRGKACESGWCICDSIRKVSTVGHLCLFQGALIRSVVTIIVIVVPCRCRRRRVSCRVMSYRCWSGRQSGISKVYKCMSISNKIKCNEHIKKLTYGHRWRFSGPLLVLQGAVIRSIFLVIALVMPCYCRHVTCWVSKW